MNTGKWQGVLQEEDRQIEIKRPGLNIMKEVYAGHQTEPEQVEPKEIPEQPWNGMISENAEPIVDKLQEMIHMVSNSPNLQTKKVEDVVNKLHENMKRLYG